MSRADSWRAARVADALLQSISVLASCRHRRWRIPALAQWNLGLYELGIDGGRSVDELRDLCDGRPISRAIAGDLDPDLPFVDRLDAVVGLVRSRRDQLLAVCDLARMTGIAVPWPEDLPVDPTTSGPALAALLRVRRGLRRRDLTAAVELQRNPLVVDPLLLPAIAAEARGFEPRRVLSLAHVAGGLRARAAWAAALLGDRLRLAWRAEGSISPRRLDNLRAALGGALPPEDPIGRAAYEERPELMAEAAPTGANEAGFAERWRAIHGRAELRDRTRQLMQAIDDWRTRHGRLPPRCLLLPLSDEVVESDPETWSAAVDAAMRDASPEKLAASLVADPGLAFKAVWTRAPVLPRSAPAWSDASYREAIACLRTAAIGTPHLRTVVRFARIAGGRPRAGALARSLLSGACPGATAVRSLGERRRLRLLDKRRDLLEHLRFADVVGCCFTSSSEYYSCDCHSTRTWVLRLWRDPLSFVFVIEEARSRRWELRGFIFGSFGVAAGAPVALLNGIYAHVQTPPRRRAILEALEDHFAGVGIHRLAIANEHAGHGWLPGNYHRAPLRVERLRALVDRHGELQRDLYDDIGGPANEPTRFDHLHWSPRLRRARG